jgi:hypothetical protein
LSITFLSISLLATSASIAFAEVAKPGTVLGEDMTPDESALAVFIEEANWDTLKIKSSQLGSKMRAAT